MFDDDTPPVKVFVAKRKVAGDDDDDDDDNDDDNGDLGDEEDGDADGVQDADVWSPPASASPRYSRASAALAASPRSPGRAAPTAPDWATAAIVADRWEGGCLQYLVAQTHGEGAKWMDSGALKRHPVLLNAYVRTHACIGELAFPTPHCLATAQAAAGGPGPVRVDLHGPATSRPGGAAAPRRRCEGPRCLAAKAPSAAAGPQRHTAAAAAPPPPCPMPRRRRRLAALTRRPVR